MGEELGIGEEEGSHQEAVPSLGQPKGKGLDSHERGCDHPRRGWQVAGGKNGLVEASCDPLLGCSRKFSHPNRSLQFSP